MIFHWGLGEYHYLWGRTKEAEGVELVVGLSREVEMGVVKEGEGMTLDRTVFELR